MPITSTTGWTTPSTTNTWWNTGTTCITSTRWRKALCSTPTLTTSSQARRPISRTHSFGFARWSTSRRSCCSRACSESGRCSKTRPPAWTCTTSNTKGGLCSWWCLPSSRRRFHGIGSCPLTPTGSAHCLAGMSSAACG